MRDFYGEYSALPKLQPLVAEITWAKAVLQHQIDNQSYAKYLLNQTNFDQTLPPDIKAQAVLAIELKVRSFQPKHKGKMEVYLEALDTQDGLPLESQTPHQQRRRFTRRYL